MASASGAAVLQDDESLARNAFFEILDLDSSGQISRTEWEKAFDWLDSNKDGCISRKEWYLKQGTSLLFDSIQRQDLAQITRGEWTRAFEAFDRNLDGNISVAEFLCDSAKAKAASWAAGPLDLDDFLAEAEAEHKADATRQAEAERRAEAEPQAVSERKKEADRKLMQLTKAETERLMKLCRFVGCSSPSECLSWGAFAEVFGSLEGEKVGAAYLQRSWADARPAGMSTIRLYEHLVNSDRISALDKLLEQAPDSARYTDPESLFQALEFTVEGTFPVRLVRMSWLLRQRGILRRGVLKKRQQLPEEAFISASELRQVWNTGGKGGKDRVAPIITVSFCWDTKEHPDPTGLQLSLVIDTLKNEHKKYSQANNGFGGFSEMGVFWDWPSLLQGDPVRTEQAKSAALREGKNQKEAEDAGWAAFRTKAEKAAFDHALHSTMDLWYAHQATTVLLLTQHPRERKSGRKNGYDQSGWTTYERCSAEQVKTVYRWEAKWAAVADLGQGAVAIEAGRRWPVGPDQFDQLIEGDKMIFTNGSDKDVVKRLFRRMSRAQLGGVTKLDFDGLKNPTPEQLAGLFGCLRLCARLEELHLGGCQIGAAGAQALAEALPAMPALRKLYLYSNALGDAGAEALARALHSAPGLNTLYMLNNNVGDGAKVAVQAAWGDRGGSLGI